MDLISRQAAIDAIEPTLKSILQGNSFKAINVMDKIRNLPSAEPEIIRCKECKWSYDDVSGRICSHGVCVDCVVGDDFYCADAERRTDEQ